MHLTAHPGVAEISQSCASEVQESQEEEMHIEKNTEIVWNIPCRKEEQYWHWHRSGTSGTQFYFKGRVLLCRVIISWRLQSLANTFNARQVSRVNKVLILKHENWRWRYYKRCYRYAATLIFKFTHLDILQRTPVKIAAKYVTRVIKLLPSQFGEKNKTAQLHYSCVWVTVKIILPHLCSLVRGNWRDLPSKYVWGIKIWLSKLPWCF